MNQIKMRPDTPRYTADFKREDDYPTPKDPKDERMMIEKKMIEQAQRDRQRRAVILL